MIELFGIDCITFSVYIDDVEEKTAHGSSDYINFGNSSFNSNACCSGRVFGSCIKGIEVYYSSCK